MEPKVVNISSDYLSDYTVIKIRSTGQLYVIHLSLNKIKLPIAGMKTISISSRIIDKINDTQSNILLPQFTYTGVRVSNGSLTKHYDYLNQLIPESKSDFNFEMFVFRMGPSHMAL
jgi:hypothetical protein